MEVIIYWQIGSPMTTKLEELKMRVTYDPTRFSTIYLTAAYEVLAPTINRAIPAAPEHHHEPVEDQVLDFKGER